MAIKLMGVAESPSTTQDFVLINHPVFFVRNAADYVDMQTASNPVRFFFSSFNPFRFRLHQGMIALAIADQKVRNALNIRYWSMTPSRFGEGACKFSARPAGGPSAFVGTDKPDFLHANLADHLASTGARPSTSWFSCARGRERCRSRTRPLFGMRLTRRSRRSPVSPFRRRILIRPSSMHFARTFVYAVALPRCAPAAWRHQPGTSGRV